MFTKNLMLTARRNNGLSMMALRTFATDLHSDTQKKGTCYELTWELKDHLRRLGITNPNVV